MSPPLNLQLQGLSPHVSGNRIEHQTSIKASTKASVIVAQDSIDFLDIVTTCSLRATLSLSPFNRLISGLHIETQMSHSFTHGVL